MSKSPAFQFYPADWLSDANVTVMTPTQRGLYIHLLCHCWIDGQISSEMEVLKVLSGLCRPGVAIADESREDIETVLKRCFVLLRSGEAYIHKRLDKERSKQKKFSKARSIAGKKGGIKSGHTRRLQRSTASKQNPSTASTNDEAKRSSLSSSSTSVEVPPKPPTGGHGDLSEIDSQSRTPTQNLRDEILVEVLAKLDAAGVKRKKSRGVDVIELEARAFVEAGGTPEDLEELAEFSQSKDDSAAYLASLLRGGEASWRYVLDAAKHERLRIVSKRLENGETLSYQEGGESPAAGNVADEGATA